MNSKAPKYMQYGDIIRFNAYGATHEAAFMAMRELTTNPGVFEIQTTEGVFYCDYNGNGVKYNEYSTAVVMCENTRKTRKALAVLKQFWGANNNAYKAIAAGFPAPSAKAQYQQACAAERRYRNDNNPVDRAARYSADVKGIDEIYKDAADESCDRVHVQIQVAGLAAKAKAGREMTQDDINFHLEYTYRIR